MTRCMHGCALALLCAAGLAFSATAAARNWSLSSQTFRATFRALEFEGFGRTICTATLEGSFHARTFSKVSGSLMGYTTRGAIGTCSQGSATVEQPSLPWHLRYSAFTGTLPNVTGVRLNLVGARFRATEPLFGITCTYIVTAERPLLFIFSREVAGALTSLFVQGRVPTDCGSDGWIEGTSTTLTVLSSASRITVTLI
jgi:hypothetical protein